MDHPIATPETLQTAAEYLSSTDPVLAPVILNSGIQTLVPHRNYYQELVESIISQQLSVLAARSIRQKFLALFDGTFPAPETIVNTSVEDLRSAGLSGAKARYIQDLAHHVIAGTVDFSHLDMHTNDEVIKELTAVKGIGEWTAHMFLMFCMGRLDVLAAGDLGIRTSIMKLYDLPELPTPAAVVALSKARGWHPYETVACHYLWQSLDNKPAIS